MLKLVSPTCLTDYSLAHYLDYLSFALLSLNTLFLHRFVLHDEHNNGQMFALSISP